MHRIGNPSKLQIVEAHLSSLGREIKVVDRKTGTREIDDDLRTYDMIMERVTIKVLRREPTYDAKILQELLERMVPDGISPYKVENFFMHDEYRPGSGVLALGKLHFEETMGSVQTARTVSIYDSMAIPRLRHTMADPPDEEGSKVMVRDDELKREITVRLYPDAISAGHIGDNIICLKDGKRL